ncbi:5'-methylthioadenosine/S-adenosylhomocysteine nucleosidase [Terrilactibacillus sp. BCM23-1]|uniref:5'-methylthioadenosine/S-adenosylhomocysteine nucleosidase n=1 Tax=Terrilactibacillus tamarindi TaxID=2599694 RepID=A0A6N8CTC2_9BACI|nr:5'-methylthioadenosine/S-adenosylhomocysteine nucleosidase [Terrilactibacillus tamarindi]MTT32467.1 5'-methylthioadenosine/S-adenosylhomocysteine nucleosidase [Terrilactibacillus tamarindi]
MKLGLIGAMEEEVEILKQKLQNRTEKELLGSKRYTGQIGPFDIVLIQSGIGKVNAAIGTTLLIHEEKPDYIINTGSAGGFNPDLNVGDVVISSEVRYHDADATVFGYEYGQIPQMPPSFEPNPLLVSIAEKAAKNNHTIQVVKGLIATGDSFMSDGERVDFVKSKFPSIQACEMEAAAIAQVCYQFHVPFVIIRSLSDIAGKEANISFDQYLVTAAKHSAELILSMLEELKEHA